MMSEQKASTGVVSLGGGGVLADSRRKDAREGSSQEGSGSCNNLLISGMTNFPR